MLQRGTETRWHSVIGTCILVASCEPSCTLQYTPKYGDETLMVDTTGSALFELHTAQIHA
jgi:hypothetical protein